MSIQPLSELPKAPQFAYEDDPFNPTPPTPKRKPTQQKTLGQLDLSQELLVQYEKANELLKNAEFEDVPLSQKAQAMNSIVNILGQIIKQQEVVRNMSEITRLELALIATLKEFPDIKERFLAQYEGNLLGQVGVAELIPHAEVLTPELALSRTFEEEA